MGKGKPTVAMIGLGGFGALWADAIAACGLTVVAGIDPDAQAQDDFKRIYSDHSPQVFNQLEDFADDVDFVIDSAPPGQRPARILQIIDRAQCVIVAKPAVASLGELDTLLATLGPQAHKIRVAMQKRHLPAFEALRTMVHNGALGEVTYLRSLVELDGTFWEPGTDWRTAMAHPNLWEGAIHQIDLMLDWLPDFDMQDINAFGWTPRDSAFTGVSDFNAMLRGHDGCVAQILARWSVSRPPITHYFEGIRIEGTRATAEVQGGRLMVDGVHHPVAQDGETFMDVARLNTRLASRLFDLTRDVGDLGLVRHHKVLAIATAIETALEA